jgi:hypothetical protein
MLAINLNPGNYTITATSFNGQMFSNKIEVLSTVIGEDLVKYFKNGSQYYVTLVDGSGNPVVNAFAMFNINGRLYIKFTDDNGTAMLDINLNPGTYIISIVNPSNNQSYSNKITVLSRLNASDITVDYKANGTYSVKVLDDIGEIVPNVTVSLNINGKIYNVTTDENGTAYLTINLLPGTYVITANFNDSFISTKVTVNRVVATIQSLTPTVKVNDYYKVLASYGGNPIAGIPIYFILNNDFNRIYRADTDANGIAQIKMNLSPGSYQLISAIDGSNFYQDIMVYNTVTVTS